MGYLCDYYLCECNIMGLIPELSLNFESDVIRLILEEFTNPIQLFLTSNYSWSDDCCLVVKEEVVVMMRGCVVIGIG